jgi:periplasmic protein TonB
MRIAPAGIVSASPRNAPGRRDRRGQSRFAGRWPLLVSAAVHVGAIVTCEIVAGRAPSPPPRIPVHFSVLQAETAALPPPLPEPAAPPVEVLPEPETPLLETPVLPDFVPLAEPPRSLLQIYRDPPPPRPRLEDVAMSRLRVAEPEQPAEAARAAPQPPAMELVAEVELVAATPTPDQDNNPAPQYPPAARRHHIQGTVIIAFDVLGDGTQLSCTIVSSSGYAMLDDAALAAAKKWRFRGGPGQVRVAFAFELRAAGTGS